MPIGGPYLHSPYVPGGSVEERRSSALQLVSQTLAMSGVILVHQREMLSIGLWKWTEAAGVSPNPKYNIRFVSDGARDFGTKVKIQHEHVWTRKWIIDRLLARPGWSETDLTGFLEQYGVACVVTESEHARLGAVKEQGWARYVAAGIGVWDRLTGAPLDLAGWAAGEAASPEVAPEPTPEVDADVTAVADIDQVIGQRAPALAPMLRRFVRSMRFGGAVSVPGGVRGAGGQVGQYFRVHDTVIEEPTPAVAYVHWSGKVSARLAFDDLPEALRAHPAVTEQKDGSYGVKVSMLASNPTSLEAAEDVVFLALEKLRSSQDA